jgi:hypothetical protein
MWLSAIKLAVSAGSKIYANKQRTKMAMSDAQLMHAQKMAEGKEAYQGKLLEARQSDWKDEAVLIILKFARGGACLGSRIVTIRQLWTRSSSFLTCSRNCRAGLQIYGYL